LPKAPQRRARVRTRRGGVDGERSEGSKVTLRADGSGEHRVVRIDARIVIEDWRQEYNAVRPHSSLNNLTPTEFAKRTPGAGRFLGIDGPRNSCWSGRPHARMRSLQVGCDPRVRSCTGTDRCGPVGRGSPQEGEGSRGRGNNRGICESAGSCPSSQAPSAIARFSGTRRTECSAQNSGPRLRAQAACRMPQEGSLARE
jgi:Integrase core domain